MSISARRRRLAADLPLAVTVVAARGKDGSPVGTTATVTATFRSEPPKLLFSLPANSETLTAAKQAQVFTVSVLSEEQKSISSRFSISDGSTGVTGLELSGAEDQPPFVVDSVGHLICSVERTIDLGDEELVVALIDEKISGFAETKPLMYFRGNYVRMHPEDGPPKEIKPGSKNPFDHSAPSVAIVGGGFSGALTAVHLLQNSELAKMRISIIERRPEVGRGLAYSTPCLAHKLNVPAGQMSAFPDQPDHFLRWVRRRDPSVGSDSFVPRYMYGDYIEDTLATAHAAAGPGVKLERINDEATEVTVLDVPKQRVRLTMKSGRELHAGWLVLASGHAEPPAPPGASDELLASDRYVGDPWDLDRLAEIDDSESVVLVGSGLTMVDTALLLGASRNRPTMQAVSRHGWLPRSHEAGAGEPLHVESPWQARELRDLTYELLAEATSAADRGGSWRSVVDSLRPWTNQIWGELTDDERQWFVSKLSRLWEIHRHRMAPEVAMAVDMMRREGRLQISAAEIVGVGLGTNGVELRTRSADGGQARMLEADRLINCTGPAADVESRTDPLLQNLLHQGLARPDKLHLGLDIEADGAIVDQRSRASSLIYAIGPLRKGALWETTAVPELRVQARDLAETLVEAARPLGLGAPARATS